VRQTPNAIQVTHVISSILSFASSVPKDRPSWPVRLEYHKRSWDNPDTSGKSASAPCVNAAAGTTALEEVRRRSSLTYLVYHMDLGANCRIPRVPDDCISRRVAIGLSVEYVHGWIRVVHACQPEDEEPLTSEFIHWSECPPGPSAGSAQRAPQQSSQRASCWPLRRRPRSRSQSA
jgi:hypothetical protein